MQGCCGPGSLCTLQCRRSRRGWQWLPLEVSLSRMRKEPCVLPDASSCRSASLRLRFLKNHLRTRGRVRAGGSRVSLPLWQRLCAAPQPYSRLRLQAVHHGHEVVGDQTLLARGERLRPPPLSAPARTQSCEPPEPDPLAGGHGDVGTPSVLTHSSRTRSFSPCLSPRSPS